MTDTEIWRFVLNLTFHADWRFYKVVYKVNLENVQFHCIVFIPVSFAAKSVKIGQEMS